MTRPTSADERGRGTPVQVRCTAGDLPASVRTRRPGTVSCMTKPKPCATRYPGCPGPSVANHFLHLPPLERAMWSRTPRWYLESGLTFERPDAAIGLALRGPAVSDPLGARLVELLATEPLIDTVRDPRTRQLAERYRDPITGKDLAHWQIQACTTREWKQADWKDLCQALLANVRGVDAHVLDLVARRAPASFLLTRQIVTHPACTAAIAQDRFEATMAACEGKADRHTLRAGLVESGPLGAVLVRLAADRPVLLNAERNALERLVEAGPPALEVAASLLADYDRHLHEGIADVVEAVLASRP